MLEFAIHAHNVSQYQHRHHLAPHEVEQTQNKYLPEARLEPGLDVD
jgi:hypothetical protein